VKGMGCFKEYLTDDSVAVRVEMINAKYRARLKEGALIGIFSQSGMSFPLVLKPGAKQLNRPQTPKPPFPYSEQEVSFQNDGFTFHGTLTLPDGYNAETPVLVMVTGSGQQNRDEELLDHRPFAVIADLLARGGIATMRFDDRGWDDKSFPYMDYGISHHKTDAEAGVRLMRERFNHVGILGHSEGGTIGLMLAAEGKVDFCVSLAGMAVSGKETLLQQNRIMLSAYGIPEATVNAYCENLAKAIDDIAAGKMTANVDDSNVPQALKENFSLAVKQLQAPYMRELLKTDIRKSLHNVKCPVLALNGKLDTQVDADINLAAIEKGLINSKHEVIAYDGLNHLFQHCQTGLTDEYRAIEETIAPEVPAKITEWVKSV
ncbi:MAG: alpha/beta hydrolase, partial [Muribaculaceae bacterium]|nr:alpha/beta hydrolase [Muribaculaceae bacterium]